MNIKNEGKRSRIISLENDFYHLNCFIRPPSNLPGTTTKNPFIQKFNINLIPVLTYLSIKSHKLKKINKLQKNILGLFKLFQRFLFIFRTFAIKCAQFFHTMLIICSELSFQTRNTIPGPRIELETLSNMKRVLCHINYLNVFM